MPPALAKKRFCVIRKNGRHFCNFHHLLGKCTNKACKLEHGVRWSTSEGVTRVDYVFGFFLGRKYRQLWQRKTAVIPEGLQNKDTRHLCNFYHLLGRCANKVRKFMCGVAWCKSERPFPINHDRRIGMARHRHFCKFHHLLGRCLGEVYIYHINHTVISK